MANNLRPTLPPLSALDLPSFPLPGMGDRRSSSPESDTVKPISRYWHRSRQLSTSSSCTDDSIRSTSPIDFGSASPPQAKYRYIRVKRVQDANAMVIQFPPMTGPAPGERHPPRGRSIAVAGAKLQRLLQSKPPTFPNGTRILVYRAIPIADSDAELQSRRSSSSTTSQQSA